MRREFILHGLNSRGAILSTERFSHDVSDVELQLLAALRLRQFEMVEVWERQTRLLQLERRSSS